jgi:Alpha-kinase family
MSRRQNRGPGDMGEAGIYKFFASHQCNRFCRSSWIKPGGGGRGGWIYSQKGTVYTPLQTRLSRNPMTRLPW